MSRSCLSRISRHFHAFFFRCTDCFKGFDNQTALLLHSVCHLKEHGRTTTATTTRTTKTSKSKSKTATLSAPNKDEPSQPVSPDPVNNSKHWECEICHKSFTTKYFLKKHNRLHTGTLVRTNCQKNDWESVVVAWTDHREFMRQAFIHRGCQSNSSCSHLRPQLSNGITFPYLVE